jgi:hypothetical protein
VSSGGTVTLENFKGKYGLTDDYWSQTFITSTNLIKVLNETGRFNTKGLMNDRLTTYNPYTHSHYYVTSSMSKKKDFNLERWIDSFMSDKVIYCPGGIGDCRGSWEYIYLNEDKSMKDCIITADVVVANWPGSIDLDDEVKKVNYIIKN